MIHDSIFFSAPTRARGRPSRVLVSNRESRLALSRAPQESWELLFSVAPSGVHELSPATRWFFVCPSLIIDAGTPVSPSLILDMNSSRERFRIASEAFDSFSPR